MGGGSKHAVKRLAGSEKKKKRTWVLRAPMDEGVTGQREFGQPALLVVIRVLSGNGRAKDE